MKQIEGFSDYFVTEQGNVWSMKREVPLMMTPGATGFKGEYLQIALCVGDGVVYRGVHRLVAEAFIPNPDNLPCVCHKNDNPHDNRVENLYWGTHKDNMEDKVSKGRGKHPIGEKCGGAVLTEDDVRFIRSYPRKRGAQTELAKMFGVNQQNISCVIRRKSWTHI